MEAVLRRSRYVKNFLLPSTSIKEEDSFNKIRLQDRKENINQNKISDNYPYKFKNIQKANKNRANRKSKKIPAS